MYYCGLTFANKQFLFIKILRGTFQASESTPSVFNANAADGTKVSAVAKNIDQILADLRIAIDKLSPDNADRIIADFDKDISVLERFVNGE